MYFSEAHVLGKIKLDAVPSAGASGYFSKAHVLGKMKWDAAPSAGVCYRGNERIFTGCGAGGWPGRTAKRQPVNVFLKKPLEFE